MVVEATAADEGRGRLVAGSVVRGGVNDDPSNDEEGEERRGDGAAGTKNASAWGARFLLLQAAAAAAATAAVLARIRPILFLRWLLLWNFQHTRRNTAGKDKNQGKSESLR